MIKKNGSAVPSATSDRRRRFRKAEDKTKNCVVGKKKETKMSPKVDQGEAKREGGEEFRRYEGVYGTRAVDDTQFQRYGVQ